MTRSRLFFAAAVLVLIAFAFGTQMARADAWEAFQTRCIAPMENFDDPVIDGLEPAEATGLTAERIDAAGAFEGQGYLPQDKSFFLVVEGDGGCIVTHNYADDRVWAQAEAWRDAELALERYEATDYAGEYHSTPWREPVFSVTLFFDPKLQIAVFTARHTDLET